MPRVAQTFTSDDKDVVASLQRLQRELVKLQQQQQKTTEESKKGSKATSDGWDGISRQLTRAERRFHFVRIGMQAVTQALAEQKRRTDELAQSAEKVAQIQGKMSVTAGARGNVNQVRDLVKDLGSRGIGITREQAHAAIGATAGTRGATNARKRELAGAAAQAWQVGLGAEEFGGLLSALDERAPGKKSITQLQDEALQMQASGVTAAEVRASKHDMGKRGEISRRVRKNEGANKLTFAEASKNFRETNDEEYAFQAVDVMEDRDNADKELRARRSAAGKRVGKVQARQSWLGSLLWAGGETVDGYVPGAASLTDAAAANAFESGMTRARSQARDQAAAQAPGVQTAEQAAAYAADRADRNQNTKALESLTRAIEQKPSYRPMTGEKGG